MRNLLLAVCILSFSPSFSWGAETPSGQNSAHRQVEELLREINRMLKRELSICGRITGHLKRYVNLLKKKSTASRQMIKELEKNIGDCRSTLLLSRKAVDGKEKENRSLRRRMAGQKFKLWAVSAASGAVILLLLL